jgi:glycerol-3-phosphate dehydrogenase
MSAGNVYRCGIGAPPEKIGAGAPYDVVVIGAGVVGCALAYRLSRHRLRVAVVESKHDVGEGTSKANSAIIHTGFDATPGSLESKLVTGAAARWPELAEKLKVPLRAVSALVLALDGEQDARLDSLLEKARANGVGDVRILAAAEVREREPNVAAGVRRALLVPRESIIDPFAVSIAFAEVALANGVDFLFGASVVAVQDAGAVVKTLATDQGQRIGARLLVNAAGLGSRRVADLYGGAPFDINPRRGQFLVYDKHTRPLVGSILLPVPSETTKGKLVAPTIFGNLLAGPTAEDLPPEQDGNTATTLDGLREVRDAAIAFCPALADHLPIAAYAGLRCNCHQGSYHIVVNDNHPGIVTITGVRSTGLSASPALADYLVERMQAECDLVLLGAPGTTDSRDESCWPGWWKHPWEDAARVTAEPDYGRIVCSCENVSRGEVTDALRSPLRPFTLDALKRRTRALTGRCQGFNCAIELASMIAGHERIGLEKVSKNGPGSEIVAPPAVRWR